MIDTSIIKITDYLASIESLNSYMTDFNKVLCILRIHIFLKKLRILHLNEMEGAHFHAK